LSKLTESAIAAVYTDITGISCGIGRELSSSPGPASATDAALSNGNGISRSRYDGDVPQYENFSRLSAVRV
jgi:hypothetical protein